ncbi:MAG: sigma-70 family RNA polymerase sigma factor [Candidatus Binatia bacterium]
MSSIDETTQILLDLARGDEAAAKKLFPQVYDELRALARHFMQQERPDHTLQPTALVNEAYLRMIDQTRVDWRGKTHFMAIAAEMMRRILVDAARKRGAEKRGGDRCRVTLHEGQAEAEDAHDVDLLALDEALDALSSLSERQARVVELRYFAGLKVEEVAFALGVSARTVKGDWRIAKAWLRHRIGE